LKPSIRALCATLLLAGLAACAPAKPRVSVPPPQLTMDEIAEQYVKLVLAVGQHDPNFVDAYYGPKEWKDQAVAEKKTLLAIRNVKARLYKDIATATPDPNVDPALWEQRKTFLRNQLGALEARVRIIEGWKPSFDDEALSLYDVQPPFYGREDFNQMLADLDQLLPDGPGTVSDRYNRFMERYAIPRDKLEPVMRAAIESAREHTQRYFRLPAGERFDLAFVSGKPWSAYNWYQGNFVSRIEVNTDLPISIGRAIELASHEGYPGHHVYNALIEDQLVRGRGWTEFTVYPLYSPQSFIAEGSADFGMELAFPPEERLALERQLFELAGFDPEQVLQYDAVTQAAKQIGAATLEAGRRHLDGQANPDETMEWMRNFALATPERAKQRVQFFDTYGAYIINYSYGEEVVKGWVERNSGSIHPDAAQWRSYFNLLSTPHTPHELLPDN